MMAARRPVVATHRETPLKRTNPSGKVRWVARYTGPDGRRRSAGTFAKRGPCGEGRADCCAQDAIDAAYERPLLAETIGTYLNVWATRYPRAERTNTTNLGRIRRVMDLKVEGRKLRDWPIRDLRRRHALELVDRMLRVQGRATTGAQNILRSLSAMAEDAITDELAEVNAFKGVRVRANDQRAGRQRKQMRVFSWEQMHAVAGAAGAARTGVAKPSRMDAWRSTHAEAMIRTLSDCGLRIGELFALRRADLDGSFLHVRGSAWEGVITASSREKNHDRPVPVPPGLVALLRAMPKRIDTEWLFPTITGPMWRYNHWRRDIWLPAIRDAGVQMTPHEMRHSYVSLLRAAGIDDADLADIAGHSVTTMVGRYTHALERSFDEVRRLVG